MMKKENSQDQVREVHLYSEKDLQNEKVKNEFIERFALQKKRMKDLLDKADEFIVLLIQKGGKDERGEYMTSHVGGMMSGQNMVHVITHFLQENPAIRDKVLEKLIIEKLKYEAE